MRRSRTPMVVVATALQVTLVIALVEWGLRAFHLDRPQLAVPLGPGVERVHRDDDLLFFSLRPNLDTRWLGTRVVTNELGLRSGAVGRKQRGEFRILSLGESTTFGAMVEVDETYSALLERRLQARDDGTRYRVINAGVCAYTSFQSVLYLERRGLALEPDLVLFYHEMNDSLPSSIRVGARGDESGLALTDRQLHESAQHTLARWLLSHSAISRFVGYQLARFRIQRLQGEDVFEGAEGIRQPIHEGKVRGAAGFQSLKLPPRVTLEERLDNLERLLALCRERGIGLLIIHPSYADSERHECVLTELCAREQLPCFEAFDSLHPTGAGSTQLFVDAFHPSKAGHAALAEGLARFLIERGLVPTQGSTSSSSR